jgi:hypothetical protein
VLAYYYPKILHPFDHPILLQFLPKRQNIVNIGPEKIFSKIRHVEIITISLKCAIKLLNLLYKIITFQMMKYLPLLMVYEKTDFNTKGKYI